MSPKQVWSQCLVVQQSSCFLSVTWCGETFHGLGFKVLKFWLSLLLYFHQVWPQHCNNVLESQSSYSMLLHPSCHLGSLSSFCYGLVPLIYLSNSGFMISLDFTHQNFISSILTLTYCGKPLQLLRLPFFLTITFYSIIYSSLLLNRLKIT
jgi:hypothetical protein